MNKKILSLLLALTMVLSLGTVAFAEGTSSKTITSVTGDNTATFDVTATANVTEGAYADIAYSVKVEWTVEALTLDIDNGELYTWNAATLQYVKDTTAKTFESKTVDATITLTNNSNAAVNYAIAYADNNTDNMTTSEAANSGSAVSGKLDNADTTTAATAADEESGHDYEIDTEKATGTGEVKTASYTGTVSLTALGDTSAITDGDDIKLGTYTVTLSAAAAEEEKTYTSIPEILASYDGFPQRNPDDGSDPTNAWTNSDNNDKLFAWYTGEAEHLRIGGNNFPLDTTVTKGDDGNYTAVISNDLPAGTETKTLTFVMNGNVLSSIVYDYVNTMVHNEFHYTFTPPTV